MSPGPGTNSQSEGAWIRKTMRTRIDYPKMAEEWQTAFLAARKRKARWTIDEIEKLLPAGTHLGNLSAVYFTMPSHQECPFSYSLARFALLLRMHREGARIGLNEEAVRSEFDRQMAHEAELRDLLHNRSATRQSGSRRKTSEGKRRSQANALFPLSPLGQNQKSASASGPGDRLLPKGRRQSCRFGFVTPAKAEAACRTTPARSSVRRASSTSRKGA